MPTIGPAVSHGFASFLPALEAALEAVPGPVLELGAGLFSTPRLHQLCCGRRPLLTLESSPEWLDRFASDAGYRHPDHCYRGVPDWAATSLDPPAGFERWGVALIDHAPGERRIHEIGRLAQSCDVLVVHDTEPGQARAGYGYDAIWPLFRYLLHDQRFGAWTTLLSNFLDVSTWTFA